MQIGPHQIGDGQCTIGVTATADIAARLGRLRPDVLLVDAPVPGSKGSAEAGQLLILASGPPAAGPVLEPAFAAIGRKTVWLGQAGQGSRMKLVVNAAPVAANMSDSLCDRADI